MTKEGYEIVILDYIDRHSVLIEFVSNGYQRWVTFQNIKNGEIKNPYHLSVYGIGYYGVGKYTARINSIKTPQYVKWFSMFNRCYDPKYHELQPTYIECEVSREFHDFQCFAQWYDRKIYSCKYPLELDKDLILKGNKIYSPSTCCFIPKEINTSINSRREDKEFMTSLYHKYKEDVPYYIRMHLLDLTGYQRKNKEKHIELSQHNP